MEYSPIEFIEYLKELRSHFLSDENYIRRGVVENMMKDFQIDQYISGEMNPCLKIQSVEIELSKLFRKFRNDFDDIRLQVIINIMNKFHFQIPKY